MEYFTNSCRECPLFNDGMDGEYKESCNHPANKGKELPLTENIPIWCPLREEHLSIHLKPAENAVR
jgi:hypothetical protein